MDPYQSPLRKGTHLIRKEESRRLTCVVVIALLAAALRFHSLGAWPYSGDETATLQEEGVLFHGVTVSQDSQTYRLAHLIPTGYFALHVSHTLFGSDEWGTRVVVALLGTLSVVLVFWFLDGPMPRTVAVVASVLVALMPQHVMHSQETRFYMVAALFAFASVLAGARTLGDGSTRFAVLSVCLAFTALLAHTLLLTLLPLILLAVYAATRAQGQTVPRSTWYVFAIAALGTSVFFALYILPLLRGWNQHETWGYSVTHAILASIAMIGWPIALMAIVGLALMLCERTAQGYYWAVCFLGWVAATVALPRFVPYHPEYVFPLVLSPLVTAAYAIAVIYELLKKRAALAAYTWLGLICLANIPALASHYVDGSRWNERDAAAYVREHWMQGDRVTGYSMGLFRHYSRRCCEPTIPLSPNSIPQLARLVSEAGRLWIVLQNTRAGLDPQVQRWLFDCAIHKLSVGGRRFDEAQFSVEVYVALAPQNPVCTRDVTVREAAATIR